MLAPESNHCWCEGHSGPTAMARTGLGICWTTVLGQRGWGLLGRQLRAAHRLRAGLYRRRSTVSGRRRWGDCAPRRQAWVAAGKASAARVAIEGGSAGGFTVLRRFVSPKPSAPALPLGRGRSGRPGSRHPPLRGHYLDGWSVRGRARRSMSSAHPCCMGRLRFTAP